MHVLHVLHVCLWPSFVGRGFANMCSAQPACVPVLALDETAPAHTEWGAAVRAAACVCGRTCAIVRHQREP